MELYANEPPAEQPVVVLAIDQAEELFRVEGGDESGALLNMIRDLAAEDEIPVIVIFAIRSDSTTHCNARSRLKVFHRAQCRCCRCQKSRTRK